MQTHCISEQLEFEGFDGRKVVAAFDGGAITSNASAVLLRRTDKAIGLFDRLADCFIDGRGAACIRSSLHGSQCSHIGRITGNGDCPWIRDVEDHDTLRHDPVLTLLSEHLTAKRSDCAVLAGKSTLNRLEHAPLGAPTHYHKIGHDGDAIERLFVDLFLEAHDKPPSRIVLDLDATDDPLHSHQEGRFCHGYYRCHCYLPLYIFGLARNQRLANKIALALQDACLACRRSGEPARLFHDFLWSTKDSWKRRRRVIAKAEWTLKGSNPRFIVTSLKPDQWQAQALIV